MGFTPAMPSGRGALPQPLYRVRAPVGRGKMHQANTKSGGRFRLFRAAGVCEANNIRTRGNSKMVENAERLLLDPGNKSPG